MSLDFLGDPTQCLPYPPLLIVEILMNFLFAHRQCTNIIAIKAL
jgi:hypothetical protein